MRRRTDLFTFHLYLHRRCTGAICSTWMPIGQDLPGCLVQGSPSDAHDCCCSGVCVAIRCPPAPAAAPLVLLAVVCPQPALASVRAPCFLMALDGTHVAGDGGRAASQTSGEGTRGHCHFIRADCCGSRHLGLPRCTSFYFIMPYPPSRALASSSMNTRRATTTFSTCRLRT
jgi:hypothetical protein